MESYIKDQLAKVEPNTNTSNYDPTFKIFACGNGEDTKKITLCKESAKVLIQWLEENYINK